MSGFSEIADRLSKLIPRLASDHPGEVTATAAAIGRTLASAGLDWHDLARCIAMQPGAASRRPVQQSDPATRSPASPSRPAGFTDKDWEEVQRWAAGYRPKARREPSPWPTWGTLSHFGRLGLFELIIVQAAVPERERAHFEAVHDAYRRQHEHPGTRDQRVFNAACRLLWEQGWRPTRRAA